MGFLALRILTISKPYVAAAYRQKIVSLAEMEGVDCGLICPVKWDNQEFEPDPQNDSRYWIRNLSIVFNGKNHFHFYRNLEASIKEFQPDLINIEEEHYSFVTFQVARIANKLKIPYVFYTWQNIFKRYPPPFSWFEQYIFSTCAGCIAGNSESIEVLRKKGYSRPVVEIPQMGIFWNQFCVETFEEGKSGAAREARAALNLPADKVIVGYVGRFVEEKGLDDVVEAATLLDATSRDKILFLFLGQGPHKERLESLMRERNVSPLFEFRSFVPSNAVAQYMRAMNALCLPSRTRPNWKEQFGRVLIEAMAAETVVVGSSSGEIPKVIGQDGIVFQEGNAKELSKALESCCTDTVTMKQLAKQGSHKAKKAFTHTAVAAQFFQFFDVIFRNELTQNSPQIK